MFDQLIPVVRLFLHVWWCPFVQCNSPVGPMACTFQHLLSLQLQLKVVDLIGRITMSTDMEMIWKWDEQLIQDDMYMQRIWYVYTYVIIYQHDLQSVICKYACLTNGHNMSSL